jgi:protein O-mannosyl-transferase
MAMRTIDLKRFLTEVKDRHTMQRARPFCFVLGAGASKQSEIPMGGELVDRWLRVLHHDAEHNGQAVENWATAKTLVIKGFEYHRREEYYGQIYARRFDGTHDTGHAELQSLLSGKEPSFGYSILAYILANTPHKAVITTNFDNLVADALYLYSNTAPLLCVHESLAPFITPQLDRPLVVKIHRDLLLHPRNAENEIDTLDKAWDAPLRTLFSHFTPIFIGYGGNDGSLMGFLDKLESPVPDRIYWCVRHGSPPNPRVKALLDKRGGTLVSIPGFDEIMLALKDALSIPDLLPDLEERHRNRVERYKKQFTELNKAVVGEANAPNASPEKKVLGQAAAAAVQQLQKEDTPDSWILRAQTEPNNDKAEALYREALIKHPASGDLKAAFGNFLADKKQDFDQAEELIKSAFDADPENPDRMHDYGLFIARYKNEPSRGLSLLRNSVSKQAEKLGPEHPVVLQSRGNLAVALRAHGQYLESEEEHRICLPIEERVFGPEHPDTLRSIMNLGCALGAQHKFDEAEREFRKSLDVQMRVLGAEHLDTMGSRMGLANTLDAQGKPDEAEKEHRAILAIKDRLFGSEHLETLASRENLAISLFRQGKLAESEAEYKKTLAIMERLAVPHRKGHREGRDRGSRVESMPHKRGHRGRWSHE